MFEKTSGQNFDFMTKNFKSGLPISRKERKHMFGEHVF